MDVLAGRFWKGFLNIQAATWPKALRREAPTGNRPDRQVGIRSNMKQSTEGAALRNYREQNRSGSFFVGLVPHLRRSSFSYSLFPALRPGLFSVGPSALQAAQIAKS
jgi:hypothetical protein